MYHELKWGLPIRDNLSYEERRKLIYEKRDYRAPMTPYRIETYLNNMSDFEFHVLDVHDPGEYGYVPDHPNRFKVIAIGEGTLDAKAVLKKLRALKQSHTTFTLNDRSEFVLDNRDLEKMDLRKIIFFMGISFWQGKTFDGSWLLDGSVILDGSIRYGLRLGFKYKLGYFTTENTARLRSVILKAKLNSNNSMGAGVVNHFGIDFWQATYFDGRWLLDGSRLLGYQRGNTKAGLILHSSFLNNSETIRYISAPIVLEIKGQEIFKPKVINRFAVDFWQRHYFDGSWLLDGKHDLDSHVGGTLRMAMKVHAEVEEQENIDAAEVITKTPDYWFLDGSVMLDGSRSFNSIYRKEGIE
jgi:hypothetical protein